MKPTVRTRHLPRPYNIIDHYRCYQAYMDFIFERVKDRNPDGSLNIMSVCPFMFLPADISLLYKGIPFMVGITCFILCRRHE